MNSQQIETFWPITVKRNLYLKHSCDSSVFLGFLTNDTELLIQYFWLWFSYLQIKRWEDSECLNTEQNTDSVQEFKDMFGDFFAFKIQSLL